VGNLITLQQQQNDQTSNAATNIAASSCLLPSFTPIVQTSPIAQPAHNSTPMMSYAPMPTVPIDFAPYNPFALLDQTFGISEFYAGQGNF
jgi:hypothetical protein